MDVYLAQPRGFCAGVTRALEIVSAALQKFGMPIYVRHEIVHNKHIIEDLQKQGVNFVEDLSEIKAKDRPVIFSAHGVSEEVKRTAQQKGLQTIDATCPLVEVVHQKIKKLEEQGVEIIVIGKPAHPEIQGTIGQLKNPQQAHIISTLEDAKKLFLPPQKKIGIVTQTTLSVQETAEIIDYLQKTYNNIIHTTQPNICFATTHRQQAVQKLVEYTKNIIIIGSKNSSNSRHLKEAALHYGAEQAWLIDDVSELNWTALENCQNLGISAGASAPEYLVDDLLKEIENHYHNVNLHHVIVAKENIQLK